MPGCYRSNMTALPAGGPGLQQRRNLVTEIPGPASRALMERRGSAVARGVSTTLPVFVTAAGGGVLLDADGNSLIDFGSGIAVASVGNSAERGGGPCAGAGRPVHPHLLHGHALRGLRGGVRGTRAAHPGHPREAVGAVQLGRGGGGERHQDRPPLHRPAGRGRLRPRLPRAHQPDDGAHRQEHAVQAGLRPVRRRNLPGADGLPAALAGRPAGVRGRRAEHGRRR